MTKKQAIQLFNDRKIKGESVIRRRENIISGKGPEEQKEFDKGRLEEPKGFYEGRMAELKEEEGRTGKKSNILVFCKLALFCVTAAFIWISVKNGWEAWSIAAAGLSAAAYLAALKKDEGYRKRLDRLRAMVRTCENELAYLSGNFSAFNDGAEYADMGHRYSFDMDIFGPDSLFNRIDRTVTKKGRDRLAERLTSPDLDKEAIESAREAVSELASVPEWRLRFLSRQKLDNGLDRLAEAYGTEREMLKGGPLPYIIISATMVFLVCGITGLLPWIFFAVMFMIQLAISIMSGSKADKTAWRIDSMHKECSGYLGLLKETETAGFSSDILKKLKERLFNEESGSITAFRELSRLLSCSEMRGNIIVFFLLNGLVMSDVLLSRRFSAWCRKYISHIGEWTGCLAELDALASLGTYAFNNPGNTYAKVLDMDSCNIMEATDISHPFLSHENAVPNSLTLKRNSIAIITGANMAGKSTFLRTIGVSYILAINGTPVRAAAFSFVPVTLFSSMRTTDNLSKDVSYFKAELLRLQQMLEHIRTHGYTLIILDEILKGTNSADKLNGSMLVLKELIKHNVSGLVATHDLELARLGETDSGHFSNHCFEIELSDEIRYSYKMKDGIAQNMNASYLIRKMLLPQR